MLHLPLLRAGRPYRSLDAVTLRDVRTGRVSHERWRPGDVLAEARLEEREYELLYREGPRAD